MADNLTTQSATPATVPASTVIATDDAGAGGHVQIVKLAIGTDGSATVIPADAANGLDVDVTRLPALAAGTNTIGKVRLVDADGDEVSVVAGVLQTSSSGGGGSTYTRIQVTPTISTGIYAAKDAVGALMTFANAAASSGAAIKVRGVEIVDKDQERAELELVLFAATITAPTDNAVFDPTDTELLDHVATIPISGGHYADFNDNSVARVNCDVLVTPTGTSLFGVLVARSTPTYTGTSDLVVTLEIERPS